MRDETEGPDGTDGTASSVVVEGQSHVQVRDELLPVGGNPSRPGEDTSADAILTDSAKLAAKTKALLESVGGEIGEMGDLISDAREELVDGARLITGDASRVKPSVDESGALSDEFPFSDGLGGLVDKANVTRRERMEGGKPSSAADRAVERSRRVALLPAPEAPKSNENADLNDRKGLSPEALRMALDAATARLKGVEKTVQGLSRMVALLSSEIDRRRYYDLWKEVDLDSDTAEFLVDMMSGRKDLLAELDSLFANTILRLGIEGLQTKGGKRIMDIMVDQVSTGRHVWTALNKIWFRGGGKKGLNTPAVRRLCEALLEKGSKGEITRIRGSEFFSSLPEDIRNGFSTPTK